MLIEKRNFFKGMNGDDSQRLLEDGYSLNIMNSRLGVTEYGRDGRNENLPGTTAITQSVYPPYGVNQCLGSAVDTARTKIIFALWNSFGYHGIYCRDIINNITYAVLYDSQVTGGLNFSKSFRIDRNMKVVGDLLYWTDNTNNIRRMNIEAGIKMNHPSYSTTVTPYSWPMNQAVINLIRRPYGLAVTATKIFAGGFGNNFIAEFAGQFAHRLIYRDGEYSCIGTPSDMINYNLPTDNYNDVQITFPLAETFDQDVQVVQLVVRYDNNPDYFVIKEWNKANASELAEINAHNAGTTNLTFNFYNNTTGIPVGQADSVKPFDSIPLTCKTLEYAINRLFLSNYLKGYDTPATTSLTASISTNGSDPASALSLKCNSPYQIGLRFRDGAKRSSFVVTNDSCIVTNPDRTYSTVPYNSIAWSLSNAAATTEIPTWAEYYDIVVTKNLRTRSFIQMLSFNLQYVKKNADGTYLYQSVYSSSDYALAVDISLLTGIGVGYASSDGDVCRLYLGTTATVYELAVIGQDGNYVLVKPTDIGSLVTQPGSYFEIYTPYKPLENETFYTIGQSYKINNPGTGSRSYSTLGGIITGDIYRFKATLFGTIHYEFMSPNINKWQNWVQFYGEGIFQSNLGQVDKGNFIQWSNVKIVGAQTNGLSTFDSLDEKSIPDVGDINKLQLTNKISDLGQGNIMLAICSSETASLYLGETQVQAASDTAYVAQSTSVIGSVNVLNGSLGTINPESVVAYLGNVYWVDILNGVFVQYSPAGLEPVSRYKQTRFFKRYAKDYSDASAGNLDNINGFHHIPTGVDAFHKEIICTLPGLIYSNYATTLPSYSSVPSYATSIINRFDIYDQLGKTMAFKYNDNIWGSNYEFMGEWYDYVENQMYGWKNGVMYSHNTNTTNWNTFYGTQYPVRVCITGNLNPSLVKDLFNIAVEGSAAPDFTVALTSVPYTQITDLAASDYTDQEGVYYAHFLRDRLSPNSTGTADERLYKGDILKDFSIFVMLEFQQYSNLMYINFVDIGYQISKGQSNIVKTVN